MGGGGGALGGSYQTCHNTIRQGSVVSRSWAPLTRIRGTAGSHSVPLTTSADTTDWHMPRGRFLPKVGPPCWALVARRSHPAVCARLACWPPPKSARRQRAALRWLPIDGCRFSRRHCPALCLKQTFALALPLAEEVAKSIAGYKHRKEVGQGKQGSGADSRICHREGMMSTGGSSGADCNGASDFMDLSIGAWAWLRRRRPHALPTGSLNQRVM